MCDRERERERMREREKERRRAKNKENAQHYRLLLNTYVCADGYIRKDIKCCENPLVRNQPKQNQKKQIEYMR